MTKKKKNLQGVYYLEKNNYLEKDKTVVQNCFEK
jgi:hypothetical protein